MSTPIPVESSHLMIDASTKFRGILALCSASVSLIIGAVTIYVYYFHYQHRVHLRSHYNNILVTAVLLLTLQSVQRVIASATLINDGMTGWFCDICGGLDIFLNAASLTCIVGFYYTIMALRYNPLRSVIVQCFGMSQSTYETIYRHFWYVIAALYSTGLTTAALVMLLKRQTPGRPSMFAVRLGYCSIQHDTDLDDTFFLVESGIPLTALVVMSVASYAAIRSHISQLRGLSWQQSWPIYVRFFSINFFLLLMIAFIGYSESVSSDGPTTLAFEAVTTPLWCAWIGLSFLVSEGIVYNACCGSGESGGDRMSDVGSKHRRPSRGSSRPRAVSDLDEPLTASTMTRSSNATARESFVGQQADGQPAQRTTTQKKRAAAQRKAVNGFTICMQSLLALEVVGVVFVQTNLDLLLEEQDTLLAGRAGRAAARAKATPREAHHSNNENGETSSKAAPSNAVTHVGSRRIHSVNTEEEESDEEDGDEEYTSNAVGDDTTIVDQSDHRRPSSS